MAPHIRRSRRQGKAIQNTRGDRCVCARLWYAMRVLRSFTASDLMAVAEAESRRTTRAFCLNLVKAGFLVAIPRANTRDPATYRLTRNSGPQCPAVLRKQGVVWDFNTSTEYPIT